MGKNIGILHYQLGGTDGVSLEVEKWQAVLEEMGHAVHLCAGDLGHAAGTQFDSLYHHSPIAEQLYRNTFDALEDYPTPAAYEAALLAAADAAEADLRRFVETHRIDVLLPQNVWSVAMNPAVAIALARVVRAYELPTVAHHHDFYWERGRQARGVSLTCAPALNLADRYLPPRDARIRHLVINSLAQGDLRARKGIEATVVPNIFDFDAPPWTVDAFNSDFRRQIGVRENDVLVLQATRVVPRKGIELAVDFVAALNHPDRRAQLMARGLYDGRPFTADSRIVLVLAGYLRDDPTGDYVARLRAKIAAARVEARFIGDRVAGKRARRDGEKVYSLWDTYVFADFVTYPSLWEGWGNQLLEALRASVPIALFEYPVFVADIAPRGFEVVSLGKTIIGRDAAGLAQVAPAAMARAADEAVVLLTDGARRQSVVTQNFRLGRQHYSMDALRRIAGSIFGEE